MNIIKVKSIKMIFLLEKKKDFNGFKNFSVQKLLNDWYLPSHGDNTSDYCSVQQQLPQVLQQGLSLWPVVPGTPGKDSYRQTLTLALNSLKTENLG